MQKLVSFKWKCVPLILNSPEYRYLYLVLRWTMEVCFKRVLLRKLRNYLGIHFYHVFEDEDILWNVEKLVILPFEVQNMLMLFSTGFVEKEIRKANIPTVDTGENPEVPFPRDMIDLEVNTYLNFSL